MAPVSPSAAAAAAAQQRRSRPSIGQILAMPPQWLARYEDFITKNAGQVSQIESALRSLTYIIPGRFRDAEIASESIHSGVQLLSLYHDSLLARAVSHLPPGMVTTTTTRLRSAHARYTRFWAQKSALYRRVAVVLQMVVYTELLVEMTAKRRGGERARWRAVVVIEAVKAVCRLLLLRVTRSRPLVTPVLPEREEPPVPSQEEEDDDDDNDNEEEQKQEREENGVDGGRAAVVGDDEGEGADEQQRRRQRRDMAHISAMDKLRRRRPRPHEHEWKMPRTGLSLPSLPDPGDISAYLQGRVLTADDIKPAPKLLNRLRGASQAAEVLHILAPLVYAVAVARSNNNKKEQSKRSSWTPWLVGLLVEYVARQLRDRGLRTTALERDEWSRRAWAMSWWLMRGACYENLTKGVVGGVRRRVPGFLGSILEDYEYLWENYHFSTSA